MCPSLVLYQMQQSLTCKGHGVESTHGGGALLSFEKTNQILTLLGSWQERML